MRLLVVLGTLLVLAIPAAAQPGMTPPNQPYGPAPQPTYSQPTYGQPTYQPVYGAAPTYAAPAATPADRPRKSETTATLAALGTTALGVAAFYRAVEDDSPALGYTSLALLMIGPSAGHIYAGEGGHAAGMSLLRTGGLLLFVAGAISVSNTEAYDCIDYCSGSSSNTDSGEAMMWLGGATVVGTALYDIYDAGRAARRANAKASARWQVAPSVMSARGQAIPAVSLGGSF